MMVALKLVIFKFAVQFFLNSHSALQIKYAKRNYRFSTFFILGVVKSKKRMKIAIMYKFSKIYIRTIKISKSLIGFVEGRNTGN